MDSIKELIALVKTRPAMYIGKRSITSLKAFLDGWYFRSPDTVEDIEVMSYFQEWIEKKYSIRSSHSWSEIILFYSQDECDALDTFFKEFETFLLGEKGNL